MTRSAVLANREEIDVEAETQLIFTNTYEDTLFVADVVSICRNKGDIFIVGGQTMFHLFGPFVNKVYLTQVIADVKGDSFFEMEFDAKIWKTAFEDSIGRQEGVNDYPYMYSILERRQRQYRYKFVQNFMTELEMKRNWIERNLDRNRINIEKYFHENLELDL